MPFAFTRHSAPPPCERSALAFPNPAASRLLPTAPSFWVGHTAVLRAIAANDNQEG